MALTITFEEDYRGSREISVSTQGIDQTFVFYIHGNLIEEADVDPTYGTDDDLKALEAAYSIIPPFRQVPMYDGTNIVLTLDSLKLTMLEYDHWRAEVSYSVSDSGGSAGGGYSRRVGDGPGAGDYRNWSEGFIQLDFNVSAVEINRKLSYATLACQKASFATNQQVPYPQGRPAPIGESIDGVEGSDVYNRQFGFGIRAFFPPQKLTFSYVRRLYRMATTINNKTFFGFPEGSVLFLEANASSDLFQVVPVQFDFKVRPNFKFLKDGPNLLMSPTVDDPAQMFDRYHDPDFPNADNGPEPGGAFSGWSVVDYRYAETEDQAIILQKPIMRVIHKVYDKSDFDKLEL